MPVPTRPPTRAPTCGTTRPTPSQFLDRQLAVRRVAMAHFGLDNIRDGEPVALLQERFSFVYFWHRYALAAIAKAIGGMEYQFAVKGDGQTAVRALPPAQQRDALHRLAATLAAGRLGDSRHRAHPAGPDAVGDRRSVSGVPLAHLADVR